MLKRICSFGIAMSLLAMPIVSRIITAAPPTTSATQPATQAFDENKLMWDCWNDLEKDEPWPTRAALDLYDRPQKSVKFLRDRLKPLKIDQKELDDSIAALGSDDEKIWRPAFEKLEYLDPRLNKGVEALLQDVSDETARSRLAALLTASDPNTWLGFDISCGSNNGWSYLTMSKAIGGNSTNGVQDKVADFGAYKPQWRRADQAIVILQHIGSPEAIAILKDMATGHPAAQPTKIAKLALESLGQGMK